jgi:hypothetical protein
LLIIVECEKGLCVICLKGETFESSFSLMSSSFVDWTVEEIVGSLTKAEVVACLPLGWIRSGDAKRWKSLEGAVLQLSDSMKTRIYEVARTKDKLAEELRNAGKKRRRDVRAWTRRVRRRLGE